jgi:Zn-dependent protease with chaperone function
MAETSVSTEKPVVEKAKRYLTLGLLLFVIPILGWLTSLYVENEWNSGLRTALATNGVMTEAEYIERHISYLELCRPGGTLAQSGENEKLCSGAAEIIDARLAAVATGGVGIALILLIVIGQKVAGNDRSKLSAVFSPMVRIVLLALSLSVIAQAGLLVYSLYTLEAAAIHRVHGGILGAIAIGALIGSFQLLRSAFSLMNETAMSLRAELLTRESHPEFYALVGQIAQKLGAQAPDNIVLGLEPNFFVTVSPVKLLSGPGIELKGRTLFMSLSLLEVLSKDELLAVIGHELGHFRGQDTEYSMKFAPIYSRLTTALTAMSGGGNASSLALLPANAVLSVCLGQFAETERTIGRERELLADKAAAEAVSAEALATALIKVSLYAGHWHGLTMHHIDELAEGRYYDNLANTYRGICSNALASINWDEAKPNFVKFVQPHPVDTHPPLGQRLQSLNVSIDDKDVSIAQPAADPAAHLIADIAEYEQRLTILEIQWLEAIGAVVIPRKKD